MPSSKTLIRKVSDKMDHSGPRVIAEFGPGEGCHTREIVRRMHPDSHLMLFEIDAELCDHLRKQFASDARITVRDTGERLRVDIWDNGAGGANPTAGTGLEGLAGRVGAVDGSFRLDSPAGGPTTIRVELPCEL